MALPKTALFLCSVAIGLMGFAPHVAAEETNEGDTGARSSSIRTAYLVGQLYSGSCPAIRDAVVVVHQGKIAAAGPRSQKRQKE